jgi:hypothetical protein
MTFQSKRLSRPLSNIPDSLLPIVFSAAKSLLLFLCIHHILSTSSLLFLVGAAAAADMRAQLMLLFAKKKKKRENYACSCSKGRGEDENKYIIYFPSHWLSLCNSRANLYMVLPIFSVSPRTRA